MTIPLGRPSPGASRDLPENLARKGAWAGCPAPSSYVVLLPVGFAMPTPLPASRCALTAPFHPYRSSKARRLSNLGGLLSVALSLRSLSPGVTRHRLSVEPGLSSTAPKGSSGHPAVWHGAVA